MGYTMATKADYVPVEVKTKTKTRKGEAENDEVATASSNNGCDHWTQVRITMGYTQIEWSLVLDLDVNTPHATSQNMSTCEKNLFNLLKNPVKSCESCANL